MQQEVPVEEYRMSVRRANEAEFALHKRTTLAFESALLSKRTRSDPQALALDMLMYQAYMTHGAIALLIEHGLMEDAATLTRRSMELGVQALYIANAPSAEERTARAGWYVEWLWREFPENGRKHLTETAIGSWESLVAPYQNRPNASPTRWGPKMSKMFLATGEPSIYKEDYFLLSAIAHGSSDRFIVDFARDSVRIQTSGAASTLLVYASRYFATVGACWLTSFPLIADADLAPLRAELNDWKRT